MTEEKKLVHKNLSLLNAIRQWKTIHFRENISRERKRGTFYLSIKETA